MSNGHGLDVSELSVLNSMDVGKLVKFTYNTTVDGEYTSKEITGIFKCAVMNHVRDIKVYIQDKITGRVHKVPYERVTYFINENNKMQYDNN